MSIIENRSGFITMIVLLMMSFLLITLIKHEQVIGAIVQLLHYQKKQTESLYRMHSVVAYAVSYCTAHYDQLLQYTEPIPSITISEWPGFAAIDTATMVITSHADNITVSVIYKQQEKSIEQSCTISKRSGQALQVNYSALTERTS